MYFKSLELNNWRQFLGGQTRIDFSTDAAAPVTVLFGPNGSGKTALLNAFTWCLYEDFTAGFEQTDRLMHEEAVAQGGSPAVEVRLTLEDDGDEFAVARRLKLGAQRSHVSVKRKPGPGKRRSGETVDASLDDIYNILPASLKDVFFLPAESLQTLSITDPTDRDGRGIDLRKSIETLLGFGLYTRASENLNGAVNADMLRRPSNYRDDTIDAARTKWQDAKAEVTRLKQRRSQLPDEIALASADLARAEEEAREHDQQAIDAWVAERDRLSENLEAARADANEAGRLLTECLRASYHALYASPLFDDAIEALNEAERDGRIPPSVSSDVLDRVLTEPELPCLMCGRELDNDSREYIQYVRDSITDSNLAANALEMRTRLVGVQQRARDELEAFGHRLDLGPAALDGSMALGATQISQQADGAVNSANSRLQEAARALDEFQSPRDGEDMDPESGRRAEAVLRNIQRTLSELKTELDNIPLRIQEAELAEGSAKIDYEKKAAKNEEYHRKQVVQTLLADTAGVFDRIAEQMRRYGVTDFQRALNEQYARMINKPYHLEVGDNFTVSANVAGRPRALSQSEKTALTLAFLAAVAGLAPKYRNLLQQSSMAAMGNIRVTQDDTYPVVLDAPYSPFDDTYAGTITTALGGMSTQVIVTTSKGAIRHLGAIEDRVGKAYVLHMSTGQREGEAAGIFSDETVRWAGNESRYVTIDPALRDARTEIREM